MTILHRFSFVHKDINVCLHQEQIQGGGIALLFKEGLNIKQDMKYNCTSMECTDYLIALPGKQVRLCLIYRPPEKNVLDFVLEFAEYMEENINFRGEHLLIGDFNIHMNNKEHQDTITFMDTLDTFALGNHIDFPTQIGQYSGPCYQQFCK